MGDVVEIGRYEAVEVRRFGRVFRLEYRLGPNPRASGPTASIRVDGEFFSTVEVGFNSDNWADVTLFLDEDRTLVAPEMVGMGASTENVMDYKFLVEAQEYLLGLLEELLSQRLVEVGAPLPPGESSPDTRLWKVSPRDRALRALEVWHNAGKAEKSLPEIVEAEIHDALRCFAAVLEELINDAPQDERSGDLVEMVVEHLSELWAEDESDEAGEEAP